MRLYRPAILGALLFLAPTVPATAAPGTTAAVELAPHRAIYTLDLAAVRDSQNITDIDGRMTFTWKDVCDGWTLRYRTELSLAFADRPGQRLGWSYSAWEGDSGERFRFFLRRFSDGSETLHRKGAARIAPGEAGTATLNEAPPRDLALPAGTLFPTAHTRAVIAAAEAGRRFHYAEVFDGTGDSGGLFAASAAIAGARPADSAPPLDSPLLAGERSWRVDMAFFPPDPGAATPQSEQSLRLYANGVAGDMRLDYSDFVIDASLSKLEPLPRPDCG